MTCNPIPPSRRTLLAQALGAGAVLALPAQARRAAPPAAGADAPARQLAALVDEAARAARAGAVLAVRGCGLDYLGAAGLARRGTRQPMPADAPLRIASVTKLAVAAVILRLAADGRLSLDAPANSLLPGEALAGIGGAGATVRQLLNHTGGVPDYYTPTNIRRWDWRQPVTAQRVLDGVRGLPASFVPGSNYAYSNTGYHILGLIAEAAGGQPLGELLRTFVFGPAGMGAASYHLANPGGPIHGYGLPGRPGADTYLYSEATGADAGITAPARDVLALLSALFLPGGQLAAIGRTMLEAPVATGRARREAGLGAEIAVGQSGVRLVGHTGDVAGYLTFAYAWPDAGAVLVGHIRADRGEVLARLLAGTVAALRPACGA
jgi:D-alanyl-D-alanine carboxypeptidase